jgi:DNA adenine methylase
MAVAELTRPVLRYHGGKWILAPWIISQFPSHRVYVEPFGGAASVLLQKQRSYAEIYNDLDGEIVNLFRVVRDHGDELKRRLVLTPFARDEFVAAYQPISDSIEQARKTVVKSFMGFGSAAVTQKKATSPGAGFKANTGFRANSNNSRTTPANDWRNYPDLLPAIIERLQGVVIENREAEKVMFQQDSPETLHYVDPPYVHDTRGLRQWRIPQSYRHEMSDDDHRKLSEVLHKLCGMVIVSGYPSPLYDKELFSDWQRVEKPALADGARKRMEVLWLSPNIKSPPDLFSHQRCNVTPGLALA